MPLPGGAIMLRPRWRRCRVTPSIPVRNEAHTPPGTAVSEAPATDSVTRPRERVTSRRPDLASNSNMTLPSMPPPTRCAADTYMAVPAGSTEMSLTSRPGGRVTLARTAPVRVARRSSLLFEPIHTEPPGPAVTDGHGPGYWRGSWGSR